MNEQGNNYVTAFLQRHLLSHSYWQQAEQNFQPVLNDILARLTQPQKTPQHNNSPLFLGINGCQGSGKSTLADYLSTQLSYRYKLNCVFFSLDDFYLSQKERMDLSTSIHPLFKTRGVPGTHNIKLLTTTLAKLIKNTGEILIPAFNKVTDNPKSKQQWQKVTLPVDVVIIEGWCWGTPAQSEHDLIKPINDFERNFDADGVWRTYVNQQLQQNYQPLYAHMDLWLMLKAPSFACVKQWRLEQEQKLAVSKPKSENKKVMNKKDVEDFIQYFQRLTEYSLVNLANNMDYVVELNDDRVISSFFDKKN